jgi:hypothetical protein
MLIKLNVGEIASLRAFVERTPGRGGFQNLMLHLWYRLDDDSGEVEIPYLLLERIQRYALQYRNAYWRRLLRRIFRRTLGANLDRGFRFQTHED